jgi:predicted transcriptional regulator
LAKITPSQQALTRALRAAVQGGAVDQAGAKALLAKAERGERVPAADVKALLEQAGDAFEPADRAALEAVVGKPLAPGGQTAPSGRPAHQIWVADRAGQMDAGAWWGGLGTLDGQLFTDAPLGQVQLGGEVFTQADIEGALGALGDHALALGDASKQHLSVGGQSSAPFLDLADIDKALS